MLGIESILTIIIFLITVILLMWRPRGLNESIPTLLGAILIIALGIVKLEDLHKISETVFGASITIISTIVMSIALESIGFFRWSAINIVIRANGSGTALYWYVLLMCFLMTIFFNNDGSILITTPIIIEIVTILKLKTNQKYPYLISGALIATAASAPIGVSNLANLIALKIVGLDLITYAKVMFVPSMLGLLSISFLSYNFFKTDIPKNIRIFSNTFHLKLIKSINQPLLAKSDNINAVDWWMFKACMSIIVLTRICFFALNKFGVPIEGIAITGAILIVIIRWYRNRMGVNDILIKTPWHIFIFSFSMYVIIFGLRNVGFTTMLIDMLKTPITLDYFNAILVTGITLTLMSNIFNNLPSVMIGTITLTEMGLNIKTLQISYLANIIGSDIGALITPVGTLATLIWMFILKKNKIKISWKKYLSATILIIPTSLLVSLISLYLWSLLFY